jgi:NAD(P)-dependent dehydrogenase (short-subunit alcohol dehydrogenase family)
MNTNLKGVFLCSKAVYPHFKKQGSGTIVNMSSDSGVSGNPDEAAYCASKGAVTNLTRAMALDYAKENIRVNAICPAVINTPMLQREIDMHEDKAAYLKEMDALHPVGRVGRPEEVAFAVLMVSSDEASFITGANISVDGGLTAV